ncbi:MAG TPA: hypothetical protein VEL75_12075 [Candidatus Methylomirabilis sp.]|nr:hypothetical protein [Candidatus Methylomirabilis sp.]
MLRHLLQQDAHAEGVEPAAPVLLRRTEAPEPGRLDAGRDAPVVLLGELGGVGIDALLDRRDLLLHDAPHLLPESR